MNSKVFVKFSYLLTFVWQVLGKVDSFHRTNPPKPQFVLGLSSETVHRRHTETRSVDSEDVESRLDILLLLFTRIECPNDISGLLCNVYSSIRATVTTPSLMRWGFTPWNRMSHSISFNSFPYIPFPRSWKGTSEVSWILPKRLDGDFVQYSGSTLSVGGIGTSSPCKIEILCPCVSAQTCLSGMTQMGYEECKSSRREPGQYKEVVTGEKEFGSYCL